MRREPGRAVAGRELTVLVVGCLLALPGCSKGAAEGSGEHAGHGHKAGAHEEQGHEEHGHEEHERGHEGHGHAEGAHEAAEADHDEHEEEEGHEEHGVVVLSPESAAQAKIRVQAVEEQAVPFMLRTTARVDFDERRLAHVSPRISGRVARVDSELGSDVKAQEVLAALDSIELGESKADYLAARAEESLARKTSRREKRLLREKVTSEQASLEARTAHEKALARLRSSEEKLRLLGLTKEEIEAVRYGDPKASAFLLRAPIDGRIVEKHLVVGELVTPGDKVFTVADLSHLWIWIDVYERDLSRVHPDDTAEVSTEAWPGRTFKGHVAYISDSVDRGTRAARARIDIPNTEGRLKPGMFAEVVLTDPHSLEGKHNGLAVPPSAVLRDGAVYVAFVEEGERRYERRELTIGARTPELVEVIRGLARGEKVVVEGAFLLKSEVAKEEMGGGHSH